MSSHWIVAHRFLTFSSALVDLDLHAALMLETIQPQYMQFGNLRIICPDTALPAWDRIDQHFEKVVYIARAPVRG